MVGFSQIKAFKKVNVDDKYFVNLDELNNLSNYKTETRKFAYIGSLRIKIILYLNKQVEYFNELKELICEIQHMCQNKFIPNVFCIETLTDDEFDIIIKRLKEANKSIIIFNK